jgi:hypothetical protein
MIKIAQIIFMIGSVIWLMNGILNEILFGWG